MGRVEMTLCLSLSDQQGECQVHGREGWEGGEEREVVVSQTRRSDVSGFMGGNGS